MSQQLRTFALLAGAAFAGSAFALAGADDPLVQADNLMAHPFMSSPAPMTGAQGRQAAWPGDTDAQAQAAELLQHNRWQTANAAGSESTGGYADALSQARQMIVGHDQ